MPVVTHSRLAQHFRNIEICCNEYIRAKSIVEADKWAAENFGVWPRFDKPLCEVLTAAYRYCELHRLDQTVGFKLQKLGEKVYQLADHKITEHAHKQKLTDAVRSLCEFARGYRAELRRRKAKHKKTEVTPPTRAPQWDKTTEARNKWVYEKCRDVTPYKQIIAALKTRPAWDNLNSAAAVKRAANAYAQRNSLPPIPRRQNGRPKKKVSAR